VRNGTAEIVDKGRASWAECVVVESQVINLGKEGT
jgi:hypothetical protein